MLDSYPILCMNKRADCFGGAADISTLEVIHSSQQFEIKENACEEQIARSLTDCTDFHISYSA